ncbi:phosphohistidine phosphatase [Sphingomonas naasensis]|uniref:Histidine phosphatase family protein n=1 Tax=Sphingomonas naasensis TaxID=1344951 RepID=A0A4S1W767_9SPHN|nr:histidine phosphatase family protein [Sphingomonas naasensis]NIJ21253.1 phosphohistidine phosphatase [Sphingomonas naasensis]TGX38694.1 histidine phosphatase family protein [Sphingomonas naasensis]
MKTLTLLRHAKSGWDDPVARDFDRPLNPKGQRAAAMVGRHMKALGLAFDHVVASPATRVAETLDHVRQGYGDDLAPVWDQRIYLASTATLLDVVHDLPVGAEHVLLAGHNPGLEELVLLLVPDGAALRDEVEIKFPTATLAEMTFETAAWDGVKAGKGTLTRFVRPRDLDPSLGPDTP